MLHEEAVNKAKILFSQNYNCAQSVLKAITDAREMKIPSVTYLAAGFGGGMGICGETCGAISGGVIAIGLLLERTYQDPMEHKEKAYEYVREFIRQFKEKHESVKCTDLIGFDISDPKKLREGMDKGVFQEVCPVFLETTVEVILEMFPPCDAC